MRVCYNDKKAEVYDFIECETRDGIMHEGLILGIGTRKNDPKCPLTMLIFNSDTGWEFVDIGEISEIHNVINMISK